MKLKKIVLGKKAWLGIGVSVLLLSGGVFSLQWASQTARGPSSSLGLSGQQTTSPAASTSTTPSSSTSSSAAVASGTSMAIPAQGLASIPVVSANHKSAIAVAYDSTMNTKSARKIIETATLDVNVTNLTHAANDLSKLAVTDGGFVESMNSVDNSNQSSLTLTVRVPEGDFNSFLLAARKIGSVNSFNQTGQDVTQQYNGLRQQFDELQNEASAYTRLFGKAQSMQDMLEIQQSLTQVNTQIADIESQLHSLDRSVQLSTVNITFHPSAIPITHGSTPFTAALLESLHGLVKAGLLGVSLLGWILPWAGVMALVAGVWRWWTRRRKSGEKR